MANEPLRVLLVAGMAGGNALIRPIARAIEQSGMRADLAPAPIFRTASVRTEAERLRAQILARPEGLIVFGYSMGGIIAALALGHLLIARRVRRFVAYDTPFDGSWAAWPGSVLGFGWTRNPSELRPDSEVLYDARRIVTDPARPWSFLAVNGMGDTLAPYPQGTLPRALTMGVAGGHLRHYFDAKLRTLLVRLLQDGGA